jgi:hypothetical protein
MAVIVYHIQLTNATEKRQDDRCLDAKYSIIFFKEREMGKSSSTLNLDNISLII